MAMAPPDAMAAEMTDVEAAPEPRMVERPEIEEALIGWLHTGHERAVGLSNGEKATWARYLRLYRGTFKEDDPRDPWVRRGVWVRQIPRSIRVLIANLMNDLMPDPSAMDNVMVQARREGLEPYAERAEAYLRAKLQTARPAAAKNVYDLTRRQLLDLYVFGTHCEIVTHETLWDRDRDELVEGPTPQYLDPRNVWPWRTNCNELKQTACTLYDPLTHGELLRGGWDNVDKVLEKCGKGELDAVPEIDPDGMGEAGEFGAEDDEAAPALENAHKRMIYIGPFPVAAIRTGLTLENDIDDDEIMLTVCEAFGLDPAAALTKPWWHLHWIGDTLIKCEPFPLPQPLGEFPVMLTQCDPENGYIWGHGLYWLCEMDERLANFFKRATMRLAAIAADPPFYYYEQSLKGSWLQKQGGVPRIGPGVGVPMMQPPPGGGKPVEHFLISPEGIPLLEAQEGKHLGTIREDSGATSAVEGSDKSGTATQSVNNLSQSVQILRYQTRNEEMNHLAGRCERMYVLGMAVLKITGDTEFVSAGYNESSLRTLDVSADNLLGLDLISIQVAGATNPGNKAAMLEQFWPLYDRAVASGEMKPRWLLQAAGDMIGLRGMNRGWAMLDPQQAQAMLFNAMALGPEGMAMLPPEVMMQVAGMMGGPGGGGKPGAGGAGGGPGRPGGGSPSAAASSGGGVAGITARPGFSGMQPSA